MHTTRKSGGSLCPLMKWRCLAMTPIPYEEPRSIHMLPGALVLQLYGCYIILSVFHSFLFGLNFAKWSSSMPLLCSLMKNESGSRVSCLPEPLCVGLVSVSPNRDPMEFSSGQASSGRLPATADVFALRSTSTWVEYTHCKVRCLQRWQGVSPSHSEMVRLHSRQTG